MRRWLQASLGLALAAGTPGIGKAAEADRSILGQLQAFAHLLQAGACRDGSSTSGHPGRIVICPDSTPMLRIEAGMHLTAINGIAADAACRLAATVASDKTIRLWTPPDGRLVRTVRLPIGAGRSGELYAVAMSRDGRYLTVGGYDAGDEKGLGFGVTVLDLEDGGLHRFGHFDENVVALALSADGAWIGVGLNAGGVRVIDRATGRELMADRRYVGEASSVTFGRDGSLFAAGEDGFLRRYGRDLRLARKVEAPDGHTPFTVAVNPARNEVAVGYDGTPKVSILDARTLAPLAKADTADLNNGDLAKLAYTADGTQLVAGGRARRGFYGHPTILLRRFDAAGRRVGDDLPVSDDTIHAVTTCGEGVAVGTGDPSIGLLSSDGAWRELQQPATIDMRGKLGDAFLASADTTAVRFGSDIGGGGPALFDLASGALHASPEPAPDLAPAIVTGLPVTGWRNTPAPAFAGAPIHLQDGEVSRSLAIRPDLAGFVLGTEWSLTGFDAKGESRWTTDVAAPVWGVDVGRDGKVLVTASGDGTLRWHRWSDGRELLSLFIDARTRRWVAWTPSGYYMASPGGEDLIAWQVNRGWDQDADLFPASRFHDTFARPDVVRAILRTLDEHEAVEQADAARAAGPKANAEPLKPVIADPPPSAGPAIVPERSETR